MEDLQIKYDSKNLVDIEQFISDNFDYYSEQNQKRDHPAMTHDGLESRIENNMDMVKEDMRQAHDDLLEDM